MKGCQRGALMFAVDPRRKDVSPPAAIAASALPAANRPDAPHLDDAGEAVGLAAALLAAGAISAQALMRGLTLHRQDGGRLEDVLLAHRLIPAQTLYGVIGRRLRLPVADLDASPPDPALIDLVGAALCLRLGMVPMRRIPGGTLVALARPADLDMVRDAVGDRLGTIQGAIAPHKSIEAAVHQTRGAALAQAATGRVDPADSCRNWNRRMAAAVIGLPLLIAVAGLLVVPSATYAVLLGWTLLTMAAATCIRVAAMLQRPAGGHAPAASDGPLPVVSVLVALYREAGIAGRLVRRLERLDYPRDRLDVVLVVEENDRITRDALDAAGLPFWMRVVTVPDGPVRTKPRALNHALELCRGSIVGVYDAEDAPAPDQLRRVVARFRVAGPRVACLQGSLDFYNPQTNWMARCFALEYAGWFRVILPGLARMGMPVPLGGTTLFFRRDILESLGAWDAFNVTEDADLGMRLARRGFSTELIDTVTMEEACCQPLPWMRQRSRWIKGYMMTLAVHMRSPAQLWRDLGPLGFLGFQVLFVATLSQFLLAPLLWLLWLVPAGVVDFPGSHAMFVTVAGSCLAAEVVNLLVAWLGRRRAGLAVSAFWSVAMLVYFPLATAAAYKAAWELVARPFFWDKTAHGLFDQGAAAQRVRNSPASTRSRVS